MESIRRNTSFLVHGLGHGRPAGGNRELASNSSELKRTLKMDFLKELAGVGGVLVRRPVSEVAALTSESYTEGKVGGRRGANPEFCIQGIIYGLKRPSTDQGKSVSAFLSTSSFLENRKGIRLFAGIGLSTDCVDFQAFSHAKSFHEKSTIKQYCTKLGQFVRICFLSNKLPCDSAVKAAELLMKPVGLVSFMSVEAMKAATSFYLLFKGNETLKNLVTALKAFMVFLDQSSYVEAEPDPSRRAHLKMQLGTALLFSTGWLRKSKKIVYKEKLQKRRYEERISRGEILDTDVYESVVQQIYDKIEGKYN